MPICQNHLPAQILRWHGGELQQFENGYYKLQGRVDDAMNLDGIKVSAIEIERALLNVPCIKETAAIAVNPPGGGPSKLIIYAVLQSKENITKMQLKIQLQIAIKKLLNPLFKIYEVILIDALPQTIANKTMRRILKNEYENVVIEAMKRVMHYGKEKPDRVCC